MFGSGTHNRSLASAAVLAACGLATPAALAQDFTSQNSATTGWHSYINGVDGRIKDTAFASRMADVFDIARLGDSGGNYWRFSAVMGQCYSGGMLDEIQPNLHTAATAATLHDRPSWGDRNGVRNAMNDYLKAWAAAVDTADKRNMRDAFVRARDTDESGPNGLRNEVPQYVSSSAAFGDTITLDMRTPRKAVLFGGSEDLDRNRNSIREMYRVLRERYGYRAADIWVLYPGGNAVLNIADSDTTVTDAGMVRSGFTRAMDWLDRQVTADTLPLVFYWNNGAHGSRARDVKKAANPGAVSVLFDLDSQFVLDFSGADGSVVERWLHVEHSALPVGVSLSLNGVPLPSLNPAGGSYDIPLWSELLVLDAGNELAVSGATLDYFSAIDLGITSAGGLVPAAGAWTVVAAAAGLAGLRRRRGR